MCSNHRSILTALLLLRRVRASSPARAATPPDDDVTVEAAIRDGVALRRAGNDEGG